METFPPPWRGETSQDRSVPVDDRDRRSRRKGGVLDDVVDRRECERGERDGDDSRVGVEDRVAERERRPARDAPDLELADREIASANGLAKVLTVAHVHASFERDGAAGDRAVQFRYAEVCVRREAPEEIGHQGVAGGSPIRARCRRVGNPGQELARALDRRPVLGGGEESHP
jgi:hypothetical protein